MPSSILHNDSLQSRFSIATLCVRSYIENRVGILIIRLGISNPNSPSNLRFPVLQYKFSHIQRRMLTVSKKNYCICICRANFLVTSNLLANSIPVDNTTTKFLYLTSKLPRDKQFTRQIPSLQPLNFGDCC